jgi:crooked neck
VKVYIAFASFETEALDFSEKDRIERADLVFKSAPQQELSKEERHQLLEAWLDFRQKQGLDAEEIQAMMPQVVKKRRRLESGGWQEYFDHVFPQDESEKPNIKLLELAHQWKSQAAEDSEDSE